MLNHHFIAGLTLIFFGASCNSSEINLPQSAPGAPPDGASLFRKYCVTCHGADGKLGLNGAKDLTQSMLGLEERVNIITNGKKLMTPFNTLLTPEEINAVANYTLTLKQ